ncbi:hypothetical protein AVEN_219994-1, partial [Araneus ventricosus]
VTQVGTRYGQSGLFYYSNPSKSAVYQVVQRESHDESVAIEDLIQAARTKFMDFYRRLTPKTRNVDKTLRNETPGHLVTKHCVTKHPGHLVTKHQSLVTRWTMGKEIW